jgi:predicted N-acetyltransferase YhbS
VPNYERKGLSRALVEPVLAVAQAEGVPVWVDSSEVGKGFYEKLGFMAFEPYELDMDGGYNVQTVMDMKWEPKRA